MGVSVAAALLLTVAHAGATIPPQDVQQQNQAFQRYWGTDIVWQFDELPAKGSVPGHQTPFSGYIYPDKAGGTKAAMRKYDLAFHRGQNLATAFEDWDTKAYKSMVDRQGPLGFVFGKKLDVPHWSGHCNGWAAASIRHAEPKQSVRINGVVFSPSDIKALLAELYIYNDIEDLSGTGATVNAGLFHVALSNWLGRGSHALGMESEPGEEKWNYPIYAYNSDSAMRAGRQVEVKLNLAYLKDSQGEYDESPRLYRVKYFHYVLSLDAAGRIIGGRYLPDSAVLDMLWMPLQPKPPRTPGNESGNPHLSVQNILAIWRASVPAEERQKWIVVDPTSEDREVELADTTAMIPLGYVPRSSAPPSPVEMTITDGRSERAREYAPRMAAKQPPAPSSTAPSRWEAAAGDTWTPSEVRPAEAASASSSTLRNAPQAGLDQDALQSQWDDLLKLLRADAEGSADSEEFTD